MADHPPAARRAVLRALKDGAHPAGLLDDARAITDPGHAASAILALAADDRLPAAKIAELIDEARRLLRKVDRPGRFAEAWGEALATAMTIRRGPGVEAAKDHLQDAALKAVLHMADGRWTSDAIIAVAPHLTGGRHRRLMRRALANPGFETEAGKVLLGIDAGLADVVREHAPAAIASNLLGHLSHHGGSVHEAVATAWTIEDEVERRDALRVIIWRIDEAAGLEAIAATCRDRDAADRVHVMASIGGRADRIGADPAPYFAKAVDALSRVAGKDAIKAHRKLAQAMERSGLEAPPKPEVAPEAPPSETSQAPAEIPVQAGARNVLALVDGYSGGMGAAHLRAVARAAPLCVAFDLDLAIIGFPDTTAENIVKLAEAETNVGEGEGYARRLLEEDRFHVIPLDNGLPTAWPGHPLATTPHPEDGKAASMDDVPRPVCLLMGLGKNGLPRKVLHAVAHHHELTGQGISLETATAMGVLADRLGRLS